MARPTWAEKTTTVNYRKRLGTPTPLGTTISDKVVKLNQGVRPIVYAMRFIERVHGFTNALPAVEISRGGWSDQSNVDGNYWRDDAGVPNIAVHPNCQQPEYTGVHEVAHFIDNFVFSNGTSYASENGRLSVLMGVIDATPSVESLRRSREIMERVAGDDPLRQQTAQEIIKRVEYLLKPYELFARAYSQYVIGMSTSRKLKRQFGDENDRSVPELSSSLTWEEEEFVPVARQLQAELVNMGLMSVKDA